jgi:dolichol-phosphate mannosyltransferase
MGFKGKVDMKLQNHEFRSGDQLPIMVVYQNGGQDVEINFTQVQEALGDVGLESIILIGDNVWSGEIRRQIDLQETETALSSSIEFSIVVPILNEIENLPVLHRRLTGVMKELGEPYEVIYVDDGSRDGSFELLRDMHLRDKCVHVISLARNFGHQQAVSAGLDRARGRAVIVMDADLQDPPEVIPQFVEAWHKGFHVVYAVREKRKEHIIKRVAYHTFYKILRAISRFDIPLEAGDFCLMDRRVVDVLTSLPERNRFVRGLRSWVGFRQMGLSYERDTRFRGKSKYTFGMLVSLALNGLISFSYLPLRISTLLGFTVSLMSLLAAGYFLIKQITSGLQPPGCATTVVLLLFLSGVQLITIGVVGEYMAQVLDEVKGRPSYVVREVLQRSPVMRQGDTENAESTHPYSR